MGISDLALALFTYNIREQRRERETNLEKSKWHFLPKVWPKNTLQVPISINNICHLKSNSI